MPVFDLRPFVDRGLDPRCDRSRVGFVRPSCSTKQMDLLSVCPQPTNRKLCSSVRSPSRRPPSTSKTEPSPGRGNGLCSIAIRQALIWWNGLLGCIISANRTKRSLKHFDATSRPWWSPSTKLTRTDVPSRAFFSVCAASGWLNGIDMSQS